MRDIVHSTVVFLLCRDDIKDTALIIIQRELRKNKQINIHFVGLFPVSAYNLLREKKAWFSLPTKTDVLLYLPLDRKRARWWSYSDEFWWKKNLHPMVTSQKAVFQFHLTRSRARKGTLGEFVDRLKRNNGSSCKFCDGPLNYTGHLDISILH